MILCCQFINKIMNYKDFFHNEYIPLMTLLDDIKNKGWREISWGSYATVFEHPNDENVLKLFVNDEGYEAYLNFVSSRKDNPHVPKIKIIIPPTKELSKTKYGLVEIEKLTPVKKDYDWRYNLVNSFNDLLVGNFDSRETFDETLDRFTEIVRREYNVLTQKHKRKDFIKALQRIDFFVENNLDLFRLIFDIKKYIRANKLEAAFDLHFGNFMIRPKTNEIVLTDPLAG